MCSLKKQASDRPNTLIIGGGWAGLSAAYKLSNLNLNQNLILTDAAPQLGGRARVIPSGLDNGQHLLIGAYQNVLGLIKNLGFSESDYFVREPFSLTMKSAHFQDPIQQLALEIPKLPTFLDSAIIPVSIRLLWKLSQIRGLSRFEKYQLIKQMLFQNQNLPDQTLEDFFKTQDNISKKIIKTLWEPLALAALTTPIESASRQVFDYTLQNSLFHKNPRYSDWLFPKSDLSELLPKPIENHLLNRQTDIRYPSRIEKLIFSPDGRKITHAQTSSGLIPCDQAILATPIPETIRILKQSDSIRFEKIIYNLSQFKFEPITTIYHHYHKPVELPVRFFGVVDGFNHWVFDRAWMGQPNILACVISSHPHHSKLLGAKSFIEHSYQELSKLIPSLKNSKPVSSQIITEKRAAFQCHPGIQALRPTPDSIQIGTNLDNLWLAGDYLNTQFPATLESAVQSGQQAAEQLAKKISQKN